MNNFVSRVTASWHRNSQCLVPERWRNITYCLSVEHLKVSLKTAVYRYGDISWPAHLPCLYACDFQLSGYMKSSFSFFTHLADLHSLRQRISKETAAMLLCKMEVLCINLYGRHLTGVLFKCSSVLVFQNSGIHLFFSTSYFE